MQNDSLWHRVAPLTVLGWYNGYATAGGGRCVGADFHSSEWRTAPPYNRESGSMTVDAPAGAHAGVAPRDSDVSGDDTYETARTFESLGVSPDLTNALADEGIVSAFPIQALTIADALAGRDVCGKAKTGSGKTLAFGLPLIQRLMGATNGAKTSCTCTASSRVGRRTSASGLAGRLAGAGPCASRVALARCRRGTPKARVLPEPVLALPHTSRPARASAIVKA